VSEQRRAFYKMCGSGNDFVFFDARTIPAGWLESAEAIQSVCGRGTGVGADGVVFVERSDVATVRMRYFNSDGSRASLCGNATLCTTRLSVELGAADPAGFTIETDAGVLPARFRDGTPEIDFAPVGEVAGVATVEPAAGESRIGFALAGVPHLVVQVYDVDQIDLDGRGRRLRFDRTLADGANVNFIAPAGDGSWLMRTYERGVEGETLACGTGAVACATILGAWGEVDGPTTIVTRSGRPLVVRPPAAPGAGPSLAGEGRIVYEGRLRERRFFVGTRLRHGGVRQDCRRDVGLGWAEGVSWAMASGSTQYSTARSLHNTYYMLLWSDPAEGASAWKTASGVRTEGARNRAAQEDMRTGARHMARPGLAC
jgi:diaminopimelate epimerase